MLDNWSATQYIIVMELSNYSKIFKALSNEQRLKIFMMIYRQSLEGSKKAAVFPIEKSSCCPIEKAFTKVCGCMDISRSTISHHFKELQNAGLIICERDGQKYRCWVNEEVVDSIKDFLK
jgi:ArsR family transcriptional regulator